MLDTLPPELLFHILKYLPLKSLGALKQTSKQWNQRFVEHEPYVYRNVAFRHGFISSTEMTLEEAVERARAAVKDISTWTEFCKQRYLLEKNWLGQGTAWCNGLAEDHDDVHRIKVDEERGIVITTHQDGGLNVRDLETDAILWGLPRTYARQYAHCEYGYGFLIFDRFGQGKEVWRIASEPEESPAPRDESQYQICENINRYINPTKGTFKPWAVLSTPDVTRAYRFVYPTLLVAGAERAYLWDILRCEIVQVIPDIHAPIAGEPLGRLHYVELSPLHVIICGTRQLRLFDRTSGACVWYLQTSHAGPSCKSILFTPASVPPPNIHDLAVFPRSPKSKMAVYNNYSQFVAAHVSSDGKTIAALTEDSSLLLIKDVLSVIGNRTKLQDASLTLTFNQPPNTKRPPEAIYLAFEFGRVGVITSAGVFLVTLDATTHGIIDLDLAHKQRQADLVSAAPARVAIAKSPFPFLQCCQILPFNQERALHMVSCLQMSQSKMFFTWNPRAMPSLEYDGDEPELGGQWEWMPFVGAQAGVNNANADAADVVDDDEDAEAEVEADEEMLVVEAVMPQLQTPGQEDAPEPTLQELVQPLHQEPGAAVFPQAWGGEDIVVEVQDENFGDGGDDNIEIEDDIWIDEDGDDGDEWIEMPQPPPPAGAAGILPAQFMLHRTINESIVACVGFTPFAPPTKNTNDNQDEA